MGQAIKGKGVVRGKGAKTLQLALEKSKADPQKAEKLRSAMRFHREVKLVK